MANTYHQIYLQFVFGVRFREALLDSRWRSQVQAVIGNIINENKCKTLIVNGVEDHLHCFAGLRPAVSVSDLMRDVKANSSKYINDRGLTPKRFEWQEGFGVFSYHHSDIEHVFNYIANQEEHHKKQSFLDEYRLLLKEFCVQFDEQYIFKELI